MNFPICVFLLNILFSSKLCAATDKFSSTQSLKDSDILVSNNSIFSFGFFSPPNTTNRYVGIWYNHPTSREVIWVANRNNPLTDSSGVLSLSVDGNLQVSNARNEMLWSSNVTSPTTKFSVAKLLDYGNLVVSGFSSNASRENGTVIWESSDHPTDSALPNMRFVLTSNSDARHVLQAWKSPSDPSVGRFSLGTNSLRLLQIIVFDGDRPYWRSGPWNGNIFTGTRYLSTGFGFIVVNTGTFPHQEVNGLVFTDVNATLLAHYVLTYEGFIVQKWWDDIHKNWEVSWNAPDNECDVYAKCGEFGFCSLHNKPICSCLKGFEPKNKDEWKVGNWKSGCQRRKPLQCGQASNEQDGFLRLRMIKVPEYAELNVGLNLDQCRSACLTNCSCLAFSYDTQISCLHWSKNLTDIADLSPDGVDLYLRLPQSELKKIIPIKAIIASIIIGVAGVLAMIWFLWRFLNRKSQSNSQLPPPLVAQLKTRKAISDPSIFGGKSQDTFNDLQIINFQTLAKATDNFDNFNLLGTGGFGQVYKGKLESGQEMAVKRLSRGSVQGTEEFMNEVELISKLQHRNLVKLLGCCVEGEEKMLIYEYLPNKSLDAFLFDPEKHTFLQWEQRFKIIQGICRGLLYLHRDSRLKIIHRDLKTSNILLDEDLNPKISDFGMARIYGGNQDQISTKRVVGTYGYMSPEYVTEGHFSEKSDVFSFGVLLLEIISGKKNSNFWYREEFLSLLGYYWKLWNEKTVNSLIDPSILSPDNQEEIIKCIHVGLLCVQTFAKDRPNTSVVMSMLVGDIKDLPSPNPPGFTLRQISTETGSSSQITEETSSTNQATITTLTARTIQQKLLKVEDHPRVESIKIALNDELHQEMMLKPIHRKIYLNVKP